MDRQGFERRLDSYSERERLDRLEIADEFPDAVGPEVVMSVRTATESGCAKVVQKQTKEGVVWVVLKVPLLPTRSPHALAARAASSNAFIAMR